MYNGTGGSLLIVVLYHATANPLTVFLEPLGGRGPTVTDLRRAEVVTAVAIVVATGPDHLPPHTANRQPCHR